MHDGAVRVICGVTKPLTRPRRTDHDRPSQARLYLVRPAAGCSRYVLCGRAQVRPRNPKSPVADRGSCTPCSGRGSLHREEGIGPRHHCAFWPQRAAFGHRRHRQGARTQGTGSRQARRRRNGQDTDRRGAGDDFRRICRGRAQGRSGRQAGARRAPSSLYVRPLQNQAQGRRGAGEKAGSEFRVRRPGRGGEGLGAHERRRRRRRVGARPYQRAGQCALSRGVCPSGVGLAQAGHRRRGPRRRGDEEARHGGAARRRAGFGA